jgi:hypothetical protein
LFISFIVPPAASIFSFAVLLTAYVSISSVALSSPSPKILYGINAFEIIPFLYKTAGLITLSSIFLSSTNF